MDQFNLSRYANLTIQRVQPPEEKLPPPNSENEKEMSDNKTDNDGGEEEEEDDEESNKIATELPEVEDKHDDLVDPVMPGIETDIDTESNATNEVTTTQVEEAVEVKQEIQDPEHNTESDGENQDQIDEEIESNSKRKSVDEKDGDQVSKKPKMTDDKTSDEDSENQTSSEKRLTNLRRNIREVMDENKLDEATLAAQRQEMERLRRVQEQQRLIREVQKQIAINKQNSKAQDRVMSLLQGGTTSLIKKSSVPSDSSVPKPNTIVISTDSGSSQGFNKKMLEILKSHPDSPEESSGPDKISSIASKLAEASEPHMVTSSVSIAPIKAAKVAEVVTISSESDEAEPERPQSSDDDCILISGDEEEEEELPDDDANNSGMHTNDAYNQPDEFGRVLVNVGHPDNEPDVFLAPQIARVIKPHQVGGVRFLYDNVVESLERFKSSAGFGCILAHSMGLGKTLQVVSFCDVFLRHTPAKHVLCIMPINTLQNWLAEFNMWLPLADETNKSPSENVIKKEEVIHRSFPLFVLNDFHKTISARGKVIQNWRNEGGVLLMGYELYRQLTSRKPRKKRNKKQMDDDFFDEKNKPLLDEMREALVKPGPDLVICDEGHRIKNSHASTSQSLKEIESRRRIVLTGYPLQNNLLEYWCMVDFVRPNYLGTKTEFSNMFERPIQNGQCIDSTPQDIRLMRYRAHVLHSLLEGFVQRRSHSVLEKTLPQKEEYVLLVRLTPLQRLLYDRFMNEVVRKKAVPNPLKAFAVCCKIWNHPDILYFFLKKRSLDEAEIDLDLEEAGTPLGTPLGPTPVTSPSAASKRSRNRWPKGGGVNPNSKELKANSNRKNLNKDLRIPAVATVMPNTSSNQIISPTVQNRNSSSVPAHSIQPNNQFDEYSSQSQPQYGITDDFSNQNFNSFNNQNPYWKEGGGDFYRGNPEYYQQGRGLDKKPQYQYPQDPTLEEGEIRLDKSEPGYQTYEDNNFRGSNDQGLYQNQAFNQDTSHSRQAELRVQNQGFSQDMLKMNQSPFLSQTANNETTSFQGVQQRFPTMQPGNVAADQTLKTKGKSVRNRKPSTNKRVPKNQTIQPMTEPGNSIENNCGDNINNLGNQQVFSNAKEPFRQEFQSQDGSRSNNNLGLLINNQNITTGPSIPLRTNNCDAKFKTSHSSLDSNNKGMYESNLVKQVNDEVSSFGSLFDGSNQMLSNRQETNRNNQSVQNNTMQSNMNGQDMNNVNNSNQLGAQNLMMNHQAIENSRMINNSSLQGNSSVGSSGLLSMHDQSEINSTNSQNSGQQHRNHPMSLSHDQEMMMSHHNISFEQKFMNTQQQQQQQDKQHQYQNSDNSLLNHETTLPVNERFMNSSNSSHNYNNFNILESNQNHNYGNMLPDQQFQSQNILSDQMLHDQEMLLANDQAMLSVLNSTTDANEQALLYNAMVGQSDGQSLLGLLDAPSIMNDQINDYQQPVYGPLPPNVKPGLPGGMKNDPENNQYYRDPKLPLNVGRGVTIMPLSQSSNDVKMYPDQSRYNIPKTPESSYQRYTNYSPMYPYASSSSTPLGSISDILDNIPGPERSYQPADRKNTAPCTVTSQDVNNPLPPFHSLDNKPKYDYSESSSNVDIDQSKDESIPSFSMDNKEGKSSEDSTEPPKIPTLLEEGEIRNPSLIMKSGKEEPGIPYDWAVELFKDYIPGMIEASAKMSLLFAIVEESIKIGDRVLLFSQSLFTLDLIEEFLQRNKIPGTDENWCRNCDYYRLDGSTSASEREKLINDFNKCTTVHLFLVSTRAGSLGINLVGANRVIVFDASWNPCHDTQAVCRVYRYGQKKPCYVYRLVTDNCLEKKIYDRQINKQVMADRVVDECNPDAHLSIKEVTNLCWDDGESKPTKDFSSLKDNYDDVVIKYIVENLSSVLTKEPFQHESLFVDRKDKKLSQAEKRLAKRSYEMEKKANSRPMYSYYGQNTNSSLYRNQMGKPMASVRPMQSMSNTAMMASRNALNRRWIPAEVWQKQGMTAQEMTLPLDVVIPTNAGDRGSIVLKAGQKVMVLKSPKGIYMQLESGKIIAIRTSGNNKPNSPALPGQTISQPQPSATQQQQSPTVPPYIVRSHSLDSSYTAAHKNDHSVQQLRNRSNLLRNNPSISITPKHTTPLPRPVQQSPYMAANSHHIPSGSSAMSSSMQQQQPKLPSSITVTKYEPFSNVQKPSEMGIQSESAGSSYNPRQPSEYPNRPTDRYAPNSRVGYPLSGRLPLPTYPTNNYPPPQHSSAPPYHRPP